MDRATQEFEKRRTGGRSQRRQQIFEHLESLLALGLGCSAILFSRRWVEDTSESVNDPEKSGPLGGYQRLYAPYFKGRAGEVMMWAVRIIGALLICAGIVGLAVT